jgi:vancomycin resistance protein YoaR
MKKEMLNMSDITKHISWRRIWVWIIPFFVVVGIIFVGLISYASSYDRRVFPGVHIGDVHVGGMEAEELQTFLQKMNDNLVDAGITLEFYEEDVKQIVRIDPTVVSKDLFVELIRMDPAREADMLVSYQKEGNMLVRAWSALLVRVTKPRLELTSVTLDTERLTDIVDERLLPFSTQPRDAGVVITGLKPVSFEIVTSSPGVTFAHGEIIGKIVSAWNSLEVPHIEIGRAVEEPAVFEVDITSLVKRLPDVLDAGALDLTYTDPHTKKKHTWTITKAFLADNIEVQKPGDVFGFGISASSTIGYLEANILDVVNEDTQEAKFEIGSNGKVVEFQGSRPGITLDVEQTYVGINEAILGRSWHEEGNVSSVPIVVKQVEPNARTSDVNDLGISEILGTGYSNFSGSPTNRVKNIRHAVQDKLHGLLIKPDEEFSLLNALKPFTLEGGYLPELVIKGDEIKPEIAGGLCQIGSTIFRTVMNSGLPVTQRRNHSLVVSYYNDHRNGKPGTDATIYDPAPDFKFKNDTGHYILLTTNMNTQNGDLYFTFWGTSNGRNGYYTEPVVHRWIPTGPEKIIETTDLEPGEKNCQYAHPGAETSFTYVKTLSNGEVEKEVFSSYYRPLPKICLLGVEEKALCQESEEGVDCDTSNGGEVNEDSTEGEDFLVPPAFPETE